MEPSRQDEPPQDAQRAVRVDRERSFWDARDDAYDRVRGWIVKAIGEFARYDDLRALYDPRGATALDFGCGRGYASLELLRRGAAHVTGLDISAAEVEHARGLAAAEGFADRSRFVVADAHATGFPDDSFDLIVGSSILHHLDLEPALRELRRILRPGGRAVFSEPLWHNPLLRVGRTLTPTARTRDEHPLTEDDWRLCATIFSGFRHEERELLTVPLMPLNLVLPPRLQRRLARRVSALDDRVLARFPGTRKYARLTFLVLE
jgi:SAM-dependent methyltransferase